MQKIHIFFLYLKFTSVWVVPVSVCSKLSCVDPREDRGKTNDDSHEPSKAYHHNSPPKSFPALIELYN